jgi:hypothetical protein
VVHVADALDKHQRVVAMLWGTRRIQDRCSLTHRCACWRPGLWVTQSANGSALAQF